MELTKTLLHVKTSSNINFKARGDFVKQLSIQYVFIWGFTKMKGLAELCV